MNLLIYEHVSGGGYAGQKIPVDILSEGYAMLRALCSDLKVCGHRVTTMLDLRLAAFNPPIDADSIIPISPRNDLDAVLHETSQVADAVYIIAPESGSLLEKLVENVETSGGTSLNCQIRAIRDASNKMRTHQISKESGVDVPETIMVDLYEDLSEMRRSIRTLGYPSVIKPLDGVGSSGLSLIRNESEIAAAARKISLESSSRYFIAQELIRGIAASVSLICTVDEALPVTLNKQTITLASPSSRSRYKGGIVPLQHTLRDEAFKLAERVVRSFKGLGGYVGVDMVLTSERPVVIEVNPRLTTSYVGLRKVVDTNPAKAIIDAVLSKRLARNVRTSGNAYFSKVAVPKPTRETLERTYGQDGVLSPPFPTEDSETSYALLISHSSGSKESKNGFQKVKKKLLDTISVRGGKSG